MRNQDKSILFSLWDKAKKYDKLAVSAERRLKIFGIKRFIFFRRFRSLKIKLQYYQELRFVYVSLALGLSRKLRLIKRKPLDH